MNPELRSPEPPPVLASGPLGWVRQNLFAGWGNSALTVGALLLVYAIARPVLSWAFSAARWEVIPANLRVFLIGRFPVGLEWRPWAAVYLALFLIGLTVALRARRRAAQGRERDRTVWAAGAVFLAVPLLLAALIGGPGWGAIAASGVAAVAGLAAGSVPGRLPLRVAVVGWLGYLPLVILLFLGFGGAGLFARVGTNLWSGLLLTLVLATIGIAASFPIGVLLALGRQSSMPLIHTFCVFYIELIRGVPLITILFMMQIMLPLFLPQRFTVDAIIRAIVGFVLFTAAYIAENVRGGLQAIPRGQYEAAHAVGLSTVQTTRLIVLPQALRTAIPVLVNQFISLFKDTALVSIVGLLDLLGIANAVLANPSYIGTQREVFVFVGALFWIFSYAMSAASRRLERALGESRQ